MTHEHTQRVLLLRDLPLEIRDCDRGLIDLRFELTNVELGDQPLLEATQRQLERLLSGCERSLRDLEVEIELTKLQIRGGHIADEREDDGSAPLLAREILGPRGLRVPAQPPPEIELPLQIRCRLHHVEGRGLTGKDLQLFSTRIQHPVDLRKESSLRH